MIDRAGTPDPVLTEIVKRLQREFAPQRIYLFGSQARGDAGPDSDYDVMVVVERRAAPMHKLAQKAHALMWDLGVSVDILVWGREEFDSRTHLRASLPALVLDEGRLLYAA
jgi:predicted nucleotidyltransferase